MEIFIVDDFVIVKGESESSYLKGFLMNDSFDDDFDDFVIVKIELESYWREMFSKTKNSSIMMLIIMMVICWFVMMVTVIQ